MMSRQIHVVGTSHGNSSEYCEEMLAATKSQVDPSDAELNQRGLRGQDEAFRELVRPYERAVFRLLKLF
jgi:hypothetical protein